MSRWIQTNLKRRFFRDSSAALPVAVADVNVNFGGIALLSEAVRGAAVFSRVAAPLGPKSSKFQRCHRRSRLHQNRHCYQEWSSSLSSRCFGVSVVDNVPEVSCWWLVGRRKCIDKEWVRYEACIVDKKGSGSLDGVQYFDLEH